MIPICRTLWLLILSTAAAGFSVGILDTATNVQLIAIHGKKVKKEDYLSCFVILNVFVVQLRSLDQRVWVRFPARVIVLCSLAKRLTLTMPVSIQDYVDEYWRTVREIRQNTKVGEEGTVAVMY